MKNLISILLLFVSFFSKAQLPGPLISENNLKVYKKPILLALWKFEYGSGEIAYDISGNNNHGKIFNPVWITEKNDKYLRNCLSFNGNSFVQTNLFVNQLPYTIMVKFKSSKNKDEQSLVDSDIGGRYGNSIILGYTNGDNTIDVQYHNGFYNSPKTYNSNEWYTAVARFQNDSVSLFVNGEFVGSKVYKQELSDGSCLRIGRHNLKDPQWFHGLIDEVAVWEGVLSEKEIKNIKYPKQSKKISADLIKLKHLESSFKKPNYKKIKPTKKNDEKLKINLHQPQPYKPTEFNKLAHAFGYYCRFEDKEKVYKYIKETDEIIEQPFFFIGDQCNGLRPYLFEYFSLLREHNHKVDESTFNYVIKNYFFKNNYKWNETEIDYKSIDYKPLDVHGKSILIYASEFGYIATVKEIIKYAEVNQLSKKNQTALTFSCMNNNIEMIKLLKKNGANTKIKDDFNKIPSNYCTSEKAKKAAK